MALHASHRLSRGDFRSVSERGKTARSSFLFMRWAPNALGKNRFGFIVPLKVSRKATVRNRIRRLLAECARRCLVPRNGSYDIIIVASSPAAAASKENIRDAFAHLAKRAGITT